MKEYLKNLFLVIVFLILLSFLFGPLFKISPEKKEISLSEFKKLVEEEKVKEIKVGEDKIFVILKDGKEKIVSKEKGVSVLEILDRLEVEKEKIEKIEILPSAERWALLWQFLIFGLPTILFIIFFWYLFKQARTGAGQIFEFTKVRPKKFGEKEGEKITFKDIAGLKEAKEEVMEIVDFLKNPKKYQQLGAKVPHGILLIGPPGTGKTMMARAIANEAGVPFFAISGSEFIELFVGVGAARIRSAFDQARRAGKAIIFIDEIDSIGKIRGVGVTGGHEEREQTLNQLLAEMDGISKEENIIILGATNRPEILDPALLRPGRFDRKIVLHLPDVQEREEILKIHCRQKPLSPNVNLKEIAQRTPGFSGADLANLVNEAALLAARKNKNQIGQEELLEAIDKVLLGPERKSHLLSQKEKEITAYHEVGHALVASFVKGGEPVRKISIIPRGLAAGYTLKAPEEERKIKTKTEILAEICTLLGGYLAEKIKFKEVSTGAQNDLEAATFLAKKFVKDFGMSSLGPISFGEKRMLKFLGFETEVEKDYSEKTAQKIDKEIEKIIKECEKKALKILTKKRKLLEKISKILIQKETLEKEEFEKLIGKTKTESLR